MSVKEKVAVITASATGIGKATALRFAREGARLVICDINNEELMKTKKEISATGAKALALKSHRRLRGQYHRKISLKWSYIYQMLKKAIP